MSNPDKHKPLSAEELFKLLENKSDKATDFEDMDDFEKDALEGFTAHLNPQKAKTLTDELNFAISKKVEETDDRGGGKNKIIWFSASASIALIFLVSIFFFNQSKQDSGNNLALKEVTEENKPSAATEQNTELETITKDHVIVEKHKEQEATKSQTVINTKSAEGVISSGLITVPSVAVSENKLSSSAAETIAIDESKNRSENDLDVLQKQAAVLTDKTDVKKKEKSNVEQEELATGYATNQNVTTTTSANEEADKLAYRSEVANDSKKTKSLEQMSQENATSKRSNDNSVSYAKTAPAPSSASTSEMNNSAYYKGSELAIKEFVLSYLKSKQITKQIIGRYKITGKVDVNGELSVSEIKQISLENCNCTNLIKEALNAMNKWHPAVQNGKATISSVEFTLMF